jgi:hypothetical protein
MSAYCKLGKKHGVEIRAKGVYRKDAGKNSEVK